MTTSTTTATATSAGRTAEGSRQTSETAISIAVCLDGSGTARINTGLGFLDHMLTSLAKHSGIDLQIEAKGDLEVDDHHTVEDVALLLGQTIGKAVGDKRGIMRFGSAYAPLDEALARAVIDLSGRPYAGIELALERDKVGDVACENITHFFHSLAMTLQAAIHVDVLKGSNDHHRAEAAFKALALALREALSSSGQALIPSTKGIL